MHCSFPDGTAGRSVVLTAGSGARLSVPFPVEVSTLAGPAVRQGYDEVRDLGGDRWSATGRWAGGGVAVTLTDAWEPSAGGRMSLRRRLRAEPVADPDATGTPVAVQLRLSVDVPAPGGAWRFCAPAMVYVADQYAGATRRTFSDHRLAFPVVLAHQAGSGTAASLSRVRLATSDAAPVRQPGDSRFVQRTEIGSVGFRCVPDSPALLASWPYDEGETSASLDSRGTPASAHFPVGPDGVDMTLEYELALDEVPGYADAVLGAFRRGVQVADPRPSTHAFSLEESVRLRTASLTHTYREWSPGGAGFVLNFDPEQGYDSEAKAFGASFAVHGMTGSRDVLEYGFTGRQLNVALVLARSLGGDWVDRGRRVVDFFATELATPSGWLYPLFDLRRQRPLFSCGDPDGPVMHYLGRSDRPGAYTRMMAEAASDLLANHRLHTRLGGAPSGWLATCRRFAAFLLRVQGPDGSWFRAYTPDGLPIRGGGWFGDTEVGGKSATSVPVPYLLDLAAELGPDSEEGAALVAAARRAGAYVLAGPVAADDHRGGTLDNPNVVDKEAALLSMRALLLLAEATGDSSFLEGASRSAKLAVTWHSAWTVPTIEGTALHRAGVRSPGWGAINSVWGAGVTDIYSLFFLADLLRLSRLTGEPLFARVAELAAHASVELLSWPGGSFGHADSGMQPEGIAFCDQGVDEGLIAKGQTWGGLGWTYTAGTDGLTRYLSERDRLPSG